MPGVVDAGVEVRRHVDHRHSVRLHEGHRVPQLLVAANLEAQDRTGAVRTRAKPLPQGDRVEGKGVMLIACAEVVDHLTQTLHALRDLEAHPLGIEAKLSLHVVHIEAKRADGRYAEGAGQQDAAHVVDERPLLGVTVPVEQVHPLTQLVLHFL